MILVDWEIKELCENDLVSPYDKSSINPASIDVKLGKTILYEDGKGNLVDYDLEKNNHELIPYILYPGDFILASTLEYIKLPINYAAELNLKSSRAREGLSHALAGFIDNGYQGIITLELHNITKNIPIKIYTGMKIGQLKIIKTQTPLKGYRGKYQNADRVLASRDK